MEVTELNANLLVLPNIVPVSGSRILLELEGKVPTGSMQTRSVLATSEAADGKHYPGAHRAGRAIAPGLESELS
jgi:hypothetical protein